MIRERQKPGPPKAEAEDTMSTYTTSKSSTQTTNANTYVACKRDADRMARLLKALKAARS